MQSDIRWIRNRVSSLVDNLTDQRDAAVNTSPAAQGLLQSSAQRPEVVLFVVGIVVIIIHHHHHHRHHHLEE